LLRSFAVAHTLNVIIVGVSVTPLQKFQKFCKMDENGRYHAPDFSLKNAKLRLNIIIIDILRASCVFIAFTFPQPCECVVFQNSDAKESFLPYKSSMIALSDMRRSNGVMNFKKSDADLFLYVFFMFLNAFYALLKATEAVYR
jgi:peroxiredoxin